MKSHKQYKLRTVRNPDGEIRWYIEMDSDFIDPVKDERIIPVRIGVAHRELKLSQIVTSGSTWNFSIIELGNILDRIEKVIRGAGLRKVRDK